MATKVLRRIKAEIILKIGFGGYRVMIREIETVSQVFTKESHQTICKSEDDNLSANMVPGFEDIEDNISNHEAEGEEQIPCPVQIFSNESKGEEPTRSNGSRQYATSKTRTPTASFSQNGYSEELIKVQQHLRKAAATKEVEQLSQQQNSQPPPGFEFDFEKNINLENHNEEKAASCEQDSTTLQYLQSQQEVSKVSKVLNFKKALTQPTSSQTDSDSDSLVQLAHDSLKFGELLGVRVTGNVEAAISRIVTPLKKIRRQGKKLKKAAKN